MVVFGLDKDLLFKSVLGHCVMWLSMIKVNNNKYWHTSVSSGLTNFDGFSKKFDSLNLTDEICTVIIFVIDGPK